MATIVVGVDGSPESRAALRWALQAAQLRAASVQAVYAYDYEPAWRLYEYGPQGPFADITLREVPALWEREAAEAERTARRLLTRVLAEVRDDLADAGQDAPAVDVEPVPVRDRRPARALVERSRTADLLVVGSRGRGGFKGLLLGSCSQQCAQVAACPVAIIPSGR
jgi:nucleotide-binding universal stress UspA family protein